MLLTSQMDQIWWDQSSVSEIFASSVETLWYNVGIQRQKRNGLSVKMGYNLPHTMLRLQ